MKKQIPAGVFYGIGAVAALLLVGALVMFFFGGIGNMSDEDVKRAEMQAQAGNERLKGYIGGTPGGPETSGEAAARDKAGATR